LDVGFGLSVVAGDGVGERVGGFGGGVQVAVQELKLRAVLRRHLDTSRRENTKREERERGAVEEGGRGGGQIYRNTKHETIPNFP
jgi:hypothetical protein